MKTPIWILSLVIILSIIPFAFADIPFDKIATQEIRIYVENDSTAHVEHEIQEFTGSAKVEFLDGHSNLNVPCLLSCPYELDNACLLYTSPSPRDRQKSRMPSSA